MIPIFAILAAVWAVTPIKENAKPQAELKSSIEVTELVQVQPFGGTPEQVVNDNALYRCIEVAPSRPLECISSKDTCLLVDGKLRFCKEHAKVDVSN